MMPRSATTRLGSLMMRIMRRPRLWRWRTLILLLVLLVSVLHLLWPGTNPISLTLNKLSFHAGPIPDAAHTNIHKLYNSSKTDNLYNLPSITKIRPFLDKYVEQLNAVRTQLRPKMRDARWGEIPKDFSIISGEHIDFFDQVQSFKGVNVFLKANLSDIQAMFPEPNLFDFGGSQATCSIVTSKTWAIYWNCEELLNRTCQCDLKNTLVPKPVDRTILSVGLPLTLKDDVEAPPVGGPQSQVLATFISVIPNGLLSAYGEVFLGDKCIKSQRCASWKFPTVYPEGHEDAPEYDEVFSLTQQSSVWYYHATIEDLPRIAPYLTFLQQHPHIKVHILRAEFHETMLAYIGISPDRLVWGHVKARLVYYPAGTACGRPTVFTTQLMSTMFRSKITTEKYQGSKKTQGDQMLKLLRGEWKVPKQNVDQRQERQIPQNHKKPMHEPQDENFKQLPALKYSSMYQRKKLENNKFSINKRNYALKQDRIVVIQRSDPSRHFRYHDDIVSMLEDEGRPYNLTVHVFKDDPLPDFVEYLELFEHAKVIVAPHGAGLSNQLFTQPETLVIEGLCYMKDANSYFCLLWGFFPFRCHTWRVSQTFRNLAVMLGNHYYAVAQPWGSDCRDIRPDQMRDAVKFYLANLVSKNSKVTS